MAVATTDSSTSQFEIRYEVLLDTAFGSTTHTLTHSAVHETLDRIEHLLPGGSPVRPALLGLVEPPEFNPYPDPEPNDEWLFSANMVGEDIPSEAPVGILYAQRQQRNTRPSNSDIRTALWVMPGTDVNIKDLDWTTDVRNQVRRDLYSAAIDHIAPEPGSILKPLHPLLDDAPVSTPIEHLDAILTIEALTDIPKHLRMQAETTVLDGLRALAVFS